MKNWIIYFATGFLGEVMYQRVINHNWNNWLWKYVSIRLEILCKFLHTYMLVIDSHAI